MVAAIVAQLWLAASTGKADSGVPQGVWLMDNEVAIEVFDCAGLLCGRIVWMVRPRDKAGLLNTDKKNPDPALRHRGTCGMTVLDGLRPDGVGRWKGGAFYNPDDGKRYSVSAQLTSADTLVARIYAGVPFFGKTKTLVRVPHLGSDGWC